MTEHSEAHKAAVKDTHNRMGEVSRLMIDTEQSIPLYVFKEVFLPYFDMRKELNDKQRAGIYALWIQRVASSPVASVRVIDDKDPTITLVTVPPLVDVRGVTITDESRTRLDGVINVHKQRVSNMPAVADNILNSALLSTVVQLEDTTQDQWKTFYRYFELPITRTEDGEFLYMDDLDESEDKEKQAAAEESEVDAADDFMDRMF